ncbi:alcohol dehydrogenase catalytic domain-containing protein [Lactococcus termiticola]|uniref:Ribulose-5-phosphate reductase n=1 Tax=Lactococcus termiticola TaxID=2169526 RepID=A0A2R5HET7_9LACT|nr:alcohol dehydrogenase catalytic domain-containing protein [Lactococcus termiticola]GBG96542.1 alcohol dehydrogenase [Lactococcus termiticola]
MLNTVYRLTAPRQIEAVSFDESLTENSVIVRPTFLSICHADQRYYTGSRDAKVLRKKLPMALIHEGVGEVVRDNTGTFPVGSRVAIVPNTPTEENTEIAENYLPSSSFRSSGFDGLMQEYVVTTPDRLVKILDEVPSNVAAYTEMISVAMHAIKRLSRLMNENPESIGIWGDGNLSYITANMAKSLYPASKIIVFGKHTEKLNFFSFVDETYTIDDIPEGLSVSHAIEAVGGIGSQYALEQIIELIEPMGSVALMGVSEEPIEFNTRLSLEKGLSFSATSRSSAQDFSDSIRFLADHPQARKRYENLVGIESEIRSIEDIKHFFEEDLTNGWGKSIMEWKI